MVQSRVSEPPKGEKGPCIWTRGGERQGGNRKLVTHQGSDQINRLRVLGARFVISEKGATNKIKLERAHDVGVKLELLM